MFYERYQYILTGRIIGWPRKRWRGQYPGRLNKPENGLYSIVAADCDDDDGGVDGGGGGGGGGGGS